MTGSLASVEQSRAANIHSYFVAFIQPRQPCAAGELLTVAVE